jgi:hypothetical protein
VKKGFLLIPLLVIGTLALFFWAKAQSPSVSTTPTQTVALSPTAIASPAASSNIEVMSPRVGEKVFSPLAVSGNARVFESVVSLRLLDSQGNILAQATAIANAPDMGKFGPFQAKIEYQLTQPQNGTLEVFAVSPKDGSEIDKVTVPIELR